MSNLKLTCRQCLGKDFELKDGFYFCEECGIQMENLIEMEYEEHNENLNTQRRIKVSDNKKKQSENLKARRLTSWEEYNFMLIGLVNEVLNIQDIPGFKVTCMQLWISYLRATEAAFFNKDTIVAPKLFAAYRKADAEILYNRKPKEKKRVVPKKALKSEASDEGVKQKLKRMRRSEKIISQELNESVKSESFNTSLLANLSLESIMSDHENAELDIEWSAAGKSTLKKKKQGSEKVKMNKLSRREKSFVLSGSTLLSIIHCALNICGSSLQLSDLIRFVREGHLSYFNLRRFLPEDITESDVPLSFQELHSYRMINYENIHRSLTHFIRIIPDLTTSIRMPNISALTRRYVDDLNLPQQLGDFVDRLMSFLPPQMIFRLEPPNYEGRAIAFVLFVLKLLFGIDGYREKEMSEAARAVNRKVKSHQPIFVYEDWRKFIEYRQVVLGKFYYPALLFHPEVSEDRPYMAFNAMLETLNPKTRHLEPQVVHNVHNERRMQSKKSAMEMVSELAKAHDDHSPQFSFAASLTPHKDNFQHIKTTVELNKRIVDVDYSSHSFEAFLSPEKFAADEGIELKTKKSTFPKCFAFAKPSPAAQICLNSIFEMQNEDSKTWREKLKQRREIEADFEVSEAEEFHQKQMEQVLAKRKMWRHKIRMKKLIAKEAETNLDESKVFSDSEGEAEMDSDLDEINCDEDPELERLFRNHQQSELTLVVPDFNMWQRSFTIIDKGKPRLEAEVEKLPSSFRWLLNLAASVLHQHPAFIYKQLLCIENQFMHIYQPVELMQNVLVKQSKMSYSSVYKTRTPLMNDEY